jgi:hypothetical protein
MRSPTSPAETEVEEPNDFIPVPETESFSRNGSLRLDSIQLVEPGDTTTVTPGTDDNSSFEAPKDKPDARAKLGVEAVDENTLRVSLELPDKDFPRLVSNPVFRPVYGSGTDVERSGLNADAVTNGAFRIVEANDEGLTLDRSDRYWNSDSVGVILLIGSDFLLIFKVSRMLINTNYFWKNLKLA